ncbi:effector-binding domain-containing protein [Actinomadura pelletieri DSM 43383]|uniref:Effector-binding domain-containing protein n=1 Tax=Actinomadura pelletieri DSM 43383 TaxID=1120940 RepID=A0A495QTI0_9ACTN|nr:GyrI-like domain-containing protein [Actinomadura pelletieri]RKS76737.1 effector-binding domain-containing protein [Actinomadura pelletieri DSM 43383]
MTTEPKIEERAAQPYVAIRRRVTMQAIGEIADRIPELFGWLGAHGIAPAGAPFLKYNAFAADGEMEIEAGVPVLTPIEPDGEVLAGTLPAGRYATVTYIGHPDGLLKRTTELLDWAKAEQLTWDVTNDRWACRLEIYETDPTREPDLTKWETELAFKLADHS